MTAIAGESADAVRRRYVLLLLFMVSMFNYIDRTIISILQVPIKQDLGLTDAQLGALTGLSFALFYSTLSLPIARWADRTIRTRIIAGALAVWSAMTALTGFATGYVSLVGFRIGVAIGEAGSIPASQSIIADLYPPRSRATVMALWGLSLPAGMTFGYLCAGALAEAIGWRMTFAVIGIVGLLLAPLVFLTMPEPRRGRFDPAAAAAALQPPMSVVLKTLWHLRSYRLLLLAGALHGYAQYAILSWMRAVLHPSIRDVAVAGVGMAGRDERSWQRRGDVPGRPAVRLLRRTRSQRSIARSGHHVADRCSLCTDTVLGRLSDRFADLRCDRGDAGHELLRPDRRRATILVPPSMRAFTNAVVLLVFNLIGLGLGPFVTGVISDVLATRYGLLTESLRYAVSTAMLFSSRPHGCSGKQEIICLQSC